MTESAAGNLKAALPENTPGAAAGGGTRHRRSMVAQRMSDAAGSQAEDFETILYHITHDLRAAVRPMAIVPGWIREDLHLDRQGVPDGLEEHLQTMERHAARLDRMLVDLRAYSRIGRLSDPPARLDLQAELDAVLESLALPPAFQVVRRIEAVDLIAPRNEFRLLLHCLVENAWKHHDRDRGRITVAACRGGAALRITVIDDGPGIERRYRDAVFEMMTTLRPRDEVEGSGLGLSIARRIVGRLGGTIEIAEPLAQRGTCVVVVLPQPDAAGGDTA